MITNRSQIHPLGASASRLGADRVETEKRHQEINKTPKTNMHKSIFIAGIPGSGKSAICQELQKLGYISYDIETIDGLFSQGQNMGKHDNQNIEVVKKTERKCDIKKLQEIINKNSKGIVFYGGNGTNIEEILPFFDKVFLLKVSPEVLCKRLSTRTGNDFGRTTDIQEWILSWKDKWEDSMCKKGAIPINADMKIGDVIDSILEQIHICI